MSIKPEQKAYRPYGSAFRILYAKEKVVGVSGPAGTGKSRACLEKMHLIAEKYPRCRILIARKTRESLTEAALFTFEAKVLPEGHPVDCENIRRSHRQQYKYPNGSIIVVCGLDKPQKIMSTEYDMIYVQEAVECEESDFEMLTTRLRNGVVPFQQLLFDCNPDAPEHWIYQRSVQGRWPLIESWHEDNPTLWEQAPPNTIPGDPEWPMQAPDGRMGRYTPFGESYLGTLDDLTGPRYYRLRLGKWVGAEGAVYEEFSQQLHMWADGDGKAPWGDSPRPPSHWPRSWVVDFGWNAPMVAQKWAEHPTDGSLWMYQEFYHTETLVEDVAKIMLETSGWSYDPERDVGHIPLEAFPDPLPRTVIMDWDAEGKATFEKHSGLMAEQAVKNITEGIQAVQRRLRKVSIFFRRDAQIEEDKSLKDRMMPTSTAQEFGGYVWDKSGGRKKGEQPLGKNDHGMDCVRYKIALRDGIIDTDPKAADIAMAAGVMSGMGMLVVGVPIPAVRRGGMRRSGTERGRTPKDKKGPARTGWRSGFGGGW